MSNQHKTYSIGSLLKGKVKWLSLFFFLSSLGCKKLVEIPAQVGAITTSQVFETDDQAASALTGIYTSMIDGSGINLYRGLLTIYTGTSADELVFFNQSAASNAQFQNNNLPATNSAVNLFWQPAYSVIYQANAAIEGLKNSTGVHDAVKSELIGEAEFIRAYCYFYLTNIFGDVPLVLTTNYNLTLLLPRTNSVLIYNQIIADLKDAQLKLATDYSSGGGQRIIPNKWAATALLARVFLYNKQWSSAEQQATSVINNSALYTLEGNLNNVFLINSAEAIWQLQQSNTSYTYNATPEGAQLIPKNSTSQPLVYLNKSLLNSFEVGDHRRFAWVDSTIYLNVKYYYPYKYKIGLAQAIANGKYTEYYMVLRLSEQYLIRAEARAQLSESGAISDLNIIRNRAGLPNYTGTALLSAIAHEYQIEFFAEWGHRWLDLKRTNQATTVLSTVKGFTVSQNSLLYPIPVNELKIDPNLTQNPGY